MSTAQGAGLIALAPVVGRLVWRRFDPPPVATPLTPSERDDIGLT